MGAENPCAVGSIPTPGTQGLNDEMPRQIKLYVTAGGPGGAMVLVLPTEYRAGPTPFCGARARATAQRHCARITDLYGCIPLYWISTACYRLLFYKVFRRLKR
jgi:hypothetical protein